MQVSSQPASQPVLDGLFLSLNVINQGKRHYFLNILDATLSLSFYFSLSLLLALKRLS